MAKEIELKLSVPEHALTALRRHPLISASEKIGTTVTLDNTYYDTAELALKSRQIGVRTRRHGRTWLQTVKCAARSQGGLSERPEWESPFSGSFDFGAVDDAATQALLGSVVSDLIPIFTTRFRRETRCHRPSEQVEILIMIDKGEVSAGERSAPICELELELVRGSSLDLLQLAGTLAEKLPVMPSDRSKAARGYALFLGQPLRPVKATASSIDDSMSVIDAFRCLAGDMLGQWQANAEGALSAQDPEFIHQLRVALRRLRSLVRYFAPALPYGFADDWNERFGSLANRFGDARDLDVLHEELVAPVASEELLGTAQMAPLISHLETQRNAAREQALRGLDGTELGREMIAFTLALHTLPANALIEAADLRTFAQLQLARMRKKARRRFTLSESMVPSHLHALRIALKRLRYGIEFFAPLFPKRAVSRYQNRLTRAQSTLGFLQDIDVARARLQRWQDDDANLEAAISFVLGWHAPAYAAGRQRCHGEVRPLLWGECPWNETR